MTSDQVPSIAKRNPILLSVFESSFKTYLSTYIHSSQKHKQLPTTCRNITHLDSMWWTIFMLKNGHFFSCKSPSLNGCQGAGSSSKVTILSVSDTVGRPKKTSGVFFLHPKRDGEKRTCPNDAFSTHAHTNYILFLGVKNWIWDPCSKFRWTSRFPCDMFGDLLLKGSICVCISCLKIMSPGRTF